MGSDEITRMKGEKQAGSAGMQGGIAASNISQKESKVHVLPTAEELCRGAALRLRTPAGGEEDFPSEDLPLTT